jgi:hypothetical protein
MLRPFREARADAVRIDEGAGPGPGRLFDLSNNDARSGQRLYAICHRFWCVGHLGVKISEGSDHCGEVRVVDWPLATRDCVTSVE